MIRHDIFAAARVLLLGLLIRIYHNLLSQLLLLLKDVGVALLIANFEHLAHGWARRAISLTFTRAANLHLKAAR